MKTPKDFQEAFDLISSAKKPDDIFGELKKLSGHLLSKKLIEIKKTRLLLAKIIHPDRNPFRKKDSEEIFSKLNNFYDQAENICKGIEEDDLKDKQIFFSTKKYDFVVNKIIHSGNICSILGGIAKDRKGAVVPVIFKAPHDPRDNDLLEIEAKNIELMSKNLKKNFDLSNSEDKKIAEQFQSRIPNLLASIKLKEPGKKDPKLLNVFSQISNLETGWFNLEEIRKEYPKGLSARQMAFIFNKTLESLTLAHVSGVVHRAVTPNHIIIHAESHLGQVIDWTSSAKLEEDQNTPYLDERYISYFPPEILDSKLRPRLDSDVFMAAWSMIFILGGNPEKKFVPDWVEEPIKVFLNKCVQSRQKFRPRNAEQAYKEWQQITFSLFGEKKFVDLKMPLA